MVATVVTHMMISLNSHVGKAPNVNGNYKKVVTVQEFEKITEVKYKSVIEQSQLPPTGAQLFQFNLNETAISVGEGLARVAKKIRTFSEPAKTISEGLIKKATHLIAQTTVITEGLAKSKKALRTFSESKSVGDSIVKQIKWVDTINEPAKTISEGLVTSRKYPRTLATQTTTIGDSLAKITKQIRSLSETITNDEAITHLRGIGFSETNTTIIDALIAHRLKSVEIIEFSYAVPTSFTLASFTHPSVITERLTHTAAPKPITDVTSILDSLQRVKRFIRGLIENVSLSPDTLHRLVNHLRTESATTISDSLARLRRPTRIITEDTPTLEQLDTTRLFLRSINPESYTSTSFTTGAFESFNLPSGDIVTITEELEAGLLPPGVKFIFEDPTVITDSLDAVTIPVPIIVTPAHGGIGSRRRTRLRWPPLYEQRPYVQGIDRQKFPEFKLPAKVIELDLMQDPITVSDSLTAVKITRAPLLPIPKTASAIVESPTLLHESEPSPEIQQPDIIFQEHPEPEEQSEPIPLAVSYPSQKSKTASSLRTLQKLLVISELEAMI